MQKVMYRHAKELFKLGHPIVAVSQFDQIGVVSKFVNMNDSAQRDYCVKTVEGLMSEKNLKALYAFDTIREAQAFLNNPKEAK